MQPNTNKAENSELRVARLERLIAGAKAEGIRVRSEWLAGEAGGACEIGGQPWIFVDLSLSVEEQLGQVEDAIRYFIAQDLG
jgi:hypothetical protein